MMQILAACDHRPNIKQHHKDKKISFHTDKQIIH
jgi:hypothetical protein